MEMGERSGGGGGRAREIWSNVSRKARAAFPDDRRWFPSRDRDVERQNGADHPCEDLRPGRATKRLEAFASSLSQFGGSIGNAIEEGLTLVETKASNLMSMRSPSRRPRKEAAVLPLVEITNVGIDFSRQLEQEMKSLREELDFVLRRCEKLEEDNERLKQENEKLIETLKQQAEMAMMEIEDDLVRMQLEKLHHEKSRLADENEKLAREIGLLRDVLEFNQLSLQDIE